MESNVKGLRCDGCWSEVQALYTGRYGGWVCDLCWAKQNGDWPAERQVRPALEVVRRDQRPGEVER
jgi:hypothetical protein